jgi:hypothetical protein
VNVAPAISAFDGATLLPGESYSAPGTFADPGADSWNATVDYGDGSGVGALPLSGKSFALSHTYRVPGTYTVTVRVSDGEVWSSRTSTVTVLTLIQGVQKIEDMVANLVKSGKLGAKEGAGLTQILESAKRHLALGQKLPAIAEMDTVAKRLELLMRSLGLSEADSAPLRALIVRLLRAASA